MNQLLSFVTAQIVARVAGNPLALGVQVKIAEDGRYVSAYGLGVNTQLTVHDDMTPHRVDKAIDKFLRQTRLMQAHLVLSGQGQA